MKKNPAKKGFIAISTVLVVAVVTLIIATVVTFISINEAQSSLASLGGEQSLNLAEGCTGDAILLVRANASYAGGTITRPEGSCSIAISKVGTTYTIVATPTGVNYVKKVQAAITRGASAITISSWQEI